MLVKLFLNSSEQSLPPTLDRVHERLGNKNIKINVEITTVPEERFSKAPKCFPSRKAIRKNMNHSFYKPVISKKDFGFKQSFMLTNFLFTRYRVNCRARNRPEKFRGFRETHPRNPDCRVYLPNKS